ncbi:MAG: hypothetical protein Q7K43_04380 [Candidatus Woesearchaeota archaeon]|nr:hypothetical protein [Candidatus Woesearchaeota archaeon]
MEMTLTAKENPLLERKEITAEIAFTGKTPSNQEVTDTLVAKMGVAKETVIVKHIHTKFGSANATVHAYAYSSAEQLAKVEPKKKEKKVVAPAGA